MRKTLLALMALGLAIFSPWHLKSARGESAEMHQLKMRQKTERKGLKQRQHYAHASVRGQNVSRAVRLQMKHQMQRERREMLTKQRDERQELKDRQRLLRESQRQLGQ